MPRTSRRARVGRLCLALALAAPGCDHVTAILEEKAQEVADEMSPPEGAAPPAGPVLSADEQLAAKLALYVECRDRASRRIRQSWQRYAEHVHEDTGTPRRDKDGKPRKPFLYEIQAELGPCDDAAAKGPTMAPSLPELETTMAAWLEHARAFAATTVELDEYYEAEAYATDAWARGKELAPGFLASWQAWSAADDELAALVEARMDVVERALLAEHEGRKGKDLEWHARNVVLHAKELVRCASGPPAAGEPAQRRPANACQAPLAALEAAAAGFRTSYQADREAAAAVFWMSAFEAAVTDFVAEAKAVLDEPRRGGPTPEQVERLAHERDDLVSDANNLRFDR